MVIIRKAIAADFPIIYEFINELEETTFDLQIQKEIYNKNLGDPDNIYLVALVNDTVVGFINCHAQHLLHHSALIGEIQEMYVIEEFRGNGIGKLLIEELKKSAISKDIHQVEVVSNTKRLRAHRFYEEEGFTHTSSKFVLPLNE